MTGVAGKRDNQGTKGSAKSQLSLTGTKNLLVFHKASFGETSIPFGALNMPSEITSYQNPSPTELLSLNLAFYKENVEVYSATRGKLVPGLTYEVKNTQISFINGFSSDENEIFFLQIKNSLTGGSSIVDAQAIRATGILPANETVFTVGHTFKVNYKPDEQIGQIAVFINGYLQMRNVNNAPANISADGNYHELDTGNGYGIQIEFNESTGLDRSIIVISLEGLVERPNISMLQHIENLAGQLDALIPVVAALTDRVGRVMMTTSTAVPPYFISAMGESIGNDGSGADNEGAEYRELYDTLWSMAGTTDDANAIYELSSTKGGSAASDWAAGKTITIDHTKNGGVFWRANTSGRDLGSYQEDTLQGHRHEPLAGSGSHFIQLQPGTLVAGGTNYSAVGTTGNPVTDGVNGTPRTADETRSKNVSYIAVICYKKFDEAAFRTAPNSVDLRAFGDQFNTLKNLYNTNQNLSEYVASSTKTKWQRKELGAQVSINGAIAALGFSNLEIGKSYRLTTQTHHYVSANINSILDYTNGAQNLIHSEHDPETSATNRGTLGHCRVFTATATSILATATVVGGSAIEPFETWALLEELPNHEETTDWN